jgi:hypothetical protein
VAAEIEPAVQPQPDRLDARLRIWVIVIHKGLSFRQFLYFLDV